MNVLLYVDDSRHWHAAARAVGALVRRTGGHVTVLTTEWTSSARREAIAEAKRVLALPEDAVEAKSRLGLVENVLPDEVRLGGHDLVVVGRLGSLDWLTNGLIAHLIVRRTPASTLIVRGKLDLVRRVLVCTEGPLHGSRAVDAGARMARAFDATATVLHVLSQFPLTYEGSEALDEVTAHFLDSSDLPEAAHLRRAKAQLRAERVRGTVKVRVGLVVDEILAEVQEGRHDVLVIGAHDPVGREGFLYQDIASLLIRASPVTVLVVRDVASRTVPTTPGETPPFSDEAGTSLRSKDKA